MTMTVEQPFRADHVYTQELHGDPDEIFPLLCPVRETEWVRGWDPTRVISETGFAEQGCVFMTEDESGTSTWFVSNLDPKDHLIEFVRFTPGYCVVFVSIRLYPVKPGLTNAECRYQYTAVSPAGRDLVASFDEDKYTAFMKEWEFELNHFLETGRMVGT
jgi:hypothetical protein